MDFDQTQAIYDYEEEEEEQVQQEKADPKKKEVAQLKVFSQQGFKETIFLVFQGDNIIGRDGKCNITIPIKALSKKHACIEVQRDLHLIYDCESKNRTKKGKSFLKPTIRYELKHGDMLTLGDVTCQYLVDLDAEEDEGDETGSETGSESMLPDATTEEELDADKPVIREDVPNKTDAISDDLLLQPVQDCKLTNPTKDDDEAYAADTDSDTDEERPLAVAAMATVLYSSEDEQETPARQKAASVSYKRNTSMEGQTLAFGLGSPDNVFRNRDSSSSAASHSGQTASVPPTLMLSSESDIQSDGKADLSSDNKQSSPRQPGTRGSGTQPTCEPTLLYGAESDDGSPVKRPRHPEVMVSDKLPDPSCDPTLLYGSESEDVSPIKKPRHPEARVSDRQDPPCDPTLLYGSESEDVSPIKKPRHPEARVSDRQDPPCDPTLLYGSESEDVSPIKKPRRPAASNVQTVLFESDSEEGTSEARKDSDARKDNEQPLLYSEIPGSSPCKAAEERTADKQEKAAAEEADATLPYAAAEMSSTDDEQESETNVDVEKPTAYTEPTQAYNTEESGKEEENDGEDKYGEDTATQPYTADSNFESESETIPFVHADKSDANQPAKPLDLEATQAYCAADEEEDSDSSDSQPLPIGPTAVAAHDDLAATLAYGLEATQAYNVTEKDDEEDDEESGRHGNDEPTLAYDLQATQAYGVGEGDDTDDEDDDKRERCIETVEGELPKTRTTVNRRDAIQATIPYGLEATQPYGADETDDEDSDDQEGVSRGGDQGRGDEPTLAYDLAATLPYGGGDDNDDDDDDGNENNDDGRDKKVAEVIVRQENQATPAYGLEETQAYDDDNNDTDSAPYSAIEATQAYGIEEPSEAEVQPNKQTAKKHTTKRVAFASSSPESTEVAEADETEVDAFESVIQTDKKSKPFTSTAADAEEDLQDSEDLIQPRSRARKGRKKPVIEESQEEESQQASGRKSPTKGKSKAANKPRKGRTQTETAGTSLTAGTTEQLEGACGTTEVETPVTTPASRRGRRVAMRVTIEPEEEEAPQDTSTRRRGRKAKEAGDQVEGSKKDTSTAAGRKRGRKTAKTSVAESSEEVDVQVEETPAPKSRRGRKGKTEQTEAVSVSETPLKTATDITVVTEAIDSQTTTTTTIDVETPNVHRGGRRKGTKVASAKKTAQAVKEQDQEESIESEAVVEATPSKGKGRGKGRGKRTHSTNEPEAVKAQDQEESIESEAVVEATPSKGKGRGKGRGKRTHSTNEPETKESLNPVFAIADEVQPQLTVASPATRGKGRGKGRGKKAQSVSEMPAVNDEELQLPESPSVAVASKGKGRGRQGRGKRTQSSIIELESSEDTSQTLSTPASRKGRGRGKVSRESSEPGHSSDVEVAETPTKKSRRGKEPSVSHSPSMRQGKPAGESNPRVIFTGLVDKQGEKVVTNLGGELVDNIHNCTHLVTDKVRRTVKFLCGLTSGQIIVLPSWLDACKKAKSFVDTSPFLVKDKDAEKQYKFDLHRSHEVALRQGLLEGYKIHVTKKVKPEPSHMKDIIQSAKGEFLSSMPRGKDDKVFVISCEEDRSVCKKPLDAGIPVVSAEVLLTGVLRQQLDLEEHKLFVEEMSDTSQDTTSSSGQSKRRREPSETSAPTSTAERRTSGSKRRKR